MNKGVNHSMAKCPNCDHAVKAGFLTAEHTCPNCGVILTADSGQLVIYSFIFFTIGFVGSSVNIFLGGLLVLCILAIYIRRQKLVVKN